MRELPTVSRDRLVDALCLVEREEQLAQLPDVARSAAEGALAQALGNVTPVCPWYLPPRSL